MVIYIHGFGGSGEGSKAKAFREYFRGVDESFIAPSLSYVPELAIKTLEELIESYSEDVKLIGSSLGGYYTIYLAQKYDLRALLINPSIYPYETLKMAIDEAVCFYDESSYEWRGSHLEMLQNYRVQTPKESNFLLLVQKGDELLNFQEAVDKLPDAKIVIEDGGSHGFDGIERHFEGVRDFLFQNI